MDQHEALHDLHDAVATMDVPDARKTATDPHDLKWLGRNIGMRNADHPKFASACRALRALGVDFIIGETE